MRRLVMTMLALAVCGGAGAVGLDLPHGKWWDDEALVERLRLEEAQREEIGALVYDHALRMIDLTAAVKRAELELAEKVEAVPLDVDGVRRAFEAFQEARRALEMERFEMLLGVRQVLTAEQWDELRRMRRERVRRQGELQRPRSGPPRGDPRAPRPEGPHRPGGGL